MLFILLSYDFKGAWDFIQVKGAVSPNFIEIETDLGTATKSKET